MALKTVHSLLIFILALCMAFMPLSRVQALSGQLQGNSLPLLDAFVSQVKNGQAAELRGVYIPAILAAHVVQQSMGNNEFVSPRQNIVTQFGLASQVGSTGLLAHNYLAGESFSLLEEDQKFYLIYGDGRVSAFVVTEIRPYQALEPANALGDLKDLQNGEQLTASAVFSKIYDRPGQVIFQTCISKGNNLSWGRLFVIAKPLSGDRQSEAE